MASHTQADASLQDIIDGAFSDSQYLIKKSKVIQSTIKILLKIHLKISFRGVVVITAAQLHSTKPELTFCAGSDPACSMSEIRDGEDL